MTAPGSLLSDVILWVRRIVKTTSDQALTDDTIRDYINRFYMYDMPARLQLFELKRQYSFDTEPNINYYTFPPRNAQNQLEQDYPLIMPPIYCDGTEIGYFQDTFQFYRAFPEQIFNEQPLNGDNGVSYTHTLSNHPIQRAYKEVGISQISSGTPPENQQFLNPGIIISAESPVMQFIVDSGELNAQGLGILDQVDSQFQNIVSQGAGTVNYITGELIFNFSTLVDDGTPITIQSKPYQASRPVAIMYFDNYIKTYPVPNKAYRIDINCQVTPAMFLGSNSAVPYSYMAEYIARGAARKLLSDEGDTEQIQFYEPFFKEQEVQVLRRTSRQAQVLRTPTIFSQNNSSSYSYWQ